MKPRVHLLCNAHLDPVWLWEWQEGAAETLSTFRTAADLCEEFDGFVFNHNEAILYRWVAEYEPELFERIKRLVAAGKWRIMGGWYLQPDCNMPSGESFVRQALVGKRYFRKHFGVEPRTAINFDPFGHTRGLVQILAKSGSDSYLFMRPNVTDCPLPADDFRWIGYDGSEVAAHRFGTGYNSGLGKAREKIEAWIEEHDQPVQIVPWGVGNHGGGPSRRDIRELNELAASTEAAEILHSSAEAYFDELNSSCELPGHEGDLNSWAPGCYTSQIRIKQAHRALENEFYRAEKMASHASAACGMEYPKRELDEALRDLLTGEFHDILPGSSIQPAEDAALRLFAHGREIASRVAARSFFALCAGQPKAAPDTYPIFAYNPHPFPVQGTFACEFNLADQNWSDSWTVFDVTIDGADVPGQIERELSNINLDWRKRIVFEATLAPGTITRIDGAPRVLESRPAPTRRVGTDMLEFHNDRRELAIDPVHGTVFRYAVDGETVLVDGVRPIVITDYEDPWASSVKEFRRVEGAFTLLDPTEAARFAGIDDRSLDPVRIVEEGPVRTVVEASMGYRDSRLLVTYRIPKRGPGFEVEISVLWQEKNRMLKLALPTPFAHAELTGQVAYGAERLPVSGKEVVNQKWQCISSGSDGIGLLCLDDGIYGSDCKYNELRLSLLRSPAYSALGDLEGRDPVAKHRHTPRIDQGERRFRFAFEGGRSRDLLERADRLALAMNEEPMILSFYPSGQGELPVPGAVLDESPVLMTSWKRTEDDDGWLLRCFNPTPRAVETEISSPCLGVTMRIGFAPWELKSLKIADGESEYVEVDLIEQPAES